MLAAVRRLAQGMLAAALASTSVLLPACGDKEERPRAKPAALTRDPIDEARARVDAFVDAPSWEGLTTLLAQPHDRARELLGPHKLRYRAELHTGPAAVPDDVPLPDVAAGEPIYERFAVTDELELRWAGEGELGPRFALAQHNQLGRGRKVTVVGGQVYAAVDDLGFYRRPLESELWRQWLDDAQYAARDLVALAGPAAQLGEIAKTELAGRPALRVQLVGSGRPRPNRVVEAPTPWRRDAQVELIAGELILDGATGLWLAAKLELRWSFEDSAGREVRGSARMDGSVTPLAEPPKIAPPAASEAIPERSRPQALRERLLGGLAGP